MFATAQISAATLLLLVTIGFDTSDPIDHLQGEMAGEVTTCSVILQSRLTAATVADDGDVPGRSGWAYFEYSTDPSMTNPKRTKWLQATAENDFIVKVKVEGLRPDATYYYRLVFGPDRQQLKRGPVRKFKTLPPPDKLARVSFVVVTGMNYAKFHQAYTGPDKHLGYPALETILKMQPDFFVGTGDNVYYDHPPKTRAKTAAEMRKKWHEQFVQPRYVDLFAAVPTYWEKDDHDYRYNDCDNTDDREPSPELGKRIFREQVPVVDPEDPHAVTYRTYRIGKLLQIWLPENRDYRSPNKLPDGPEKTIWGEKQREWLKQTLLESEAVFKIIISPTPMVGPDDAYKRDNHCNPKGFRYEGTQFFRWAKEHSFLDKGLYIVCGDRHWQYHSIHPTGFEEFSCGALVDANARLGRSPGDPRSTDPEGKIKQLFTSPEPSGGFLRVVVEPLENNIAACHFEFYDEKGKLLYKVVKKQPIQ